MAQKNNAAQYNRFGEKAHNMSIKQDEIRPKHLCKRPHHPIEVRIRPGLTVYTDKKSKIPAILKKYEGK